jgi:hypothetical protein
MFFKSLTVKNSYIIADDASNFDFYAADALLLCGYLVAEGGRSFS